MMDMDGIEDLSEEELAILISEIDSLSNEELGAIYSSMDSYEVPLVDIDTFIEDPYYLGQALGGNNSDGTPRVWTCWREHLRVIFPNPYYSPYLEICVTGAIGIGKSTVGIIGMLYDMYRILNIKNPQDKFNLLQSTKIAFAIMNASMRLAGGVNASQMRDLIESSPFFKSKIQHNGDTLFINKVNMVVGSRFTHALGMAVISAMIDEANFQDAVKDQALDNYNNIRRRMDSRFESFDSGYPARLWLLSSKNDDASFLEMHIESVRNEAKSYVIEMPIWVAKRDKTKYSGVTFKCFIGDDNKDPFIIEGEVPEYIDQDHVIEVPIEYHDRFDKDLVGALKDLAGVSAASSYKLFKKKESIYKVMVIENAFTASSIQLTFDGPDSLKDHLTDYLVTRIKDKSQPRYIHIDTALKGDRLGLAMCHAHGIKKITRTDAFTLDKTIFNEASTRHDFAIGIKAQPGSEIPFYKIREFIVYLRDDLGYNISCISTDGFQSADMRQMLTRQGFKVEYTSVDRTKEPYLAFKSAVTEERAELPKNEILLDEMKDVEDMGKKIDHTIDGSKDILDAVVGSYINCIKLHDVTAEYSSEMISQMRSKIVNRNPMAKLNKMLGIR